MPSAAYKVLHGRLFLQTFGPQFLLGSRQMVSYKVWRSLQSGTSQCYKNWNAIVRPWSHITSNETCTFCIILESTAKLTTENERLKEGHRSAEQKSTEASTKLSVLQQYFKEKEVEMQKWVDTGYNRLMSCLFWTHLCLCALGSYASVSFFYLTKIHNNSYLNKSCS